MALRDDGVLFDGDELTHDGPCDSLHDHSSCSDHIPDIHGAQQALLRSVEQAQCGDLHQHGRRDVQHARGILLAQYHGDHHSGGRALGDIRADGHKNHQIHDHKPPRDVQAHIARNALFRSGAQPLNGHDQTLYGDLRHHSDDQVHLLLDV